MRTKLLVLLVLAFGMTYPAQAQKKKKDKNPPPASTAPKSDSTKGKGGPQPYSKVITGKAKTQKGLFTVHKVDENYFFEIPDSVIGREFIAITRISKTPAGAGYGGREENRQVLRWEKGPSNKLFLRAVLYISASGDSTKPIMEAIRNSNVEPIAASFDIKALSNDKKNTVINVTDFFKGDNQLISIEPGTKRRFSLTNLQADRSYIKSIKAFPINAEVQMVHRPLQRTRLLSFPDGPVRALRWLDDPRSYE
jgi:hypothetical protein